jgi:hypothetical protein
VGEEGVGGRSGWKGKGHDVAASGSLGRATVKEGGVGGGVRCATPGDLDILSTTGESWRKAENRSFEGSGVAAREGEGVVGAGASGGDSESIAMLGESRL